MEVKFKFEIMDRVVVSLNGLEGDVVGNWIDRDRIKNVSVRYVTPDKNVEYRWFREDELKSCPVKKKRRKVTSK